MKKEYSLVIGSVFFLISALIDRLAGPVSIAVRNPWTFLTQSVFLKYPFTSLAIGLKTFGLVIFIVLLLSFIEKAYFNKAFITFVVSLFAILYAIQQTATGGRTTPIQWTLAFAYAAAILVVPLVYYIIKGIVVSLYSGLAEKKETAGEEENKEPQNQ